MVLKTANINGNKIIFILMNVLFFLIALLIQQHFFKQSSCEKNTTRNPD